ncbi:unnamed protein product [Vitrella brassicaformis CCMP3155]|uniref:U-box domain-containing protein n=1 Tax=Vitrella brassicaformis (strain CCMP3155) TaxID=1169540 RepID=A0A0G4GBS6_VITBC|nr:unnamed protein product [Vitrella brassicaformis CCMP3155]|eukprot:CEM26552.1 unnamed protein product [Vitrella brassicaformis CCMP3155]
MADKDLPPFLPICPITMAVPKVPVLSTTQNIYEREALVTHLRLNHRYKSPTSRKPLTPNMKVSDRTAISVIEQYGRSEMEKRRRAEDEKRRKRKRDEARKERETKAMKAVRGGGAFVSIDLADNEDSEMTKSAPSLPPPPSKVVGKINDTCLDGLLQWVGSVDSGLPTKGQAAELKSMLLKHNLKGDVRRWVSVCVGDKEWESIHPLLLLQAISAMIRAATDRRKKAKRPSV